MRNFILLLISFISLHTSAQEKESYYIFNENWQGVKDVKMTKFFIHTLKINDTCWQWDYYNYLGPRLKTESYKDPDGKLPNGFFAYYSNAGSLDSCGFVSNWNKDKVWTYFSGDSDKVYMRKTYNQGKLISTVDYRDTAKLREDEANEKTFAKVEVESEFIGGIKSWQTFLNKNLRYPQRALDAEVQGMVRILFVVDTKGKVTEPVISKSVEFSLDQEAFRIIQMAPSWTPAFQNGRMVKSYKVQPIIFKLEVEN